MAHSPAVVLIKAAAVDVAPPKGGVAVEPTAPVETGAASETQSSQIIYLNNGCKAAAPVRERERVAWDRLCLCVHLDVWDCVFVDHGDRLIGAHETESGPCQPSNVSSLCRNQSPIEKRLVVLSRPA